MLKLKKLTLGISPCPNDTFIFDALIHNKLVECPFEFDVVYHDVQTLNEMAQSGALDVIKISYGNLLKVISKYKLLYSGGAMGYGCGPLLLSNGTSAIDWERPVYLPGLNTTASALFSYWAAKNIQDSFKPAYLFFDSLYSQLVKTPRMQGVVIHESRFTFRNDGLTCIQDLGEYWEQETGLPIPLGGIVIKDSLTSEARKLDYWIEQSIRYAMENPDDSRVYIKEKAQIGEDSVVQQHIETYVNEFSLSMGKKGVEAIRALLETLQSDLVFDVSKIMAYR